MDTNTRITSDIYQINEYLENLKSKHIHPEDSNSLIMGMYGYLGDVFSNQIQDNIILSSQWLDEIFPIRAKLEKSLLTYATMANIKDLNAVPSRMDILIGIKENELLANMNADIYTIDKNTIINIEKYEFHVENNINIFRQDGISGDNIYISQYNFDEYNRLSTITNPYLLPPVRTRVGNDSFIFIRARVRQQNILNYSKKIISNNSVENKTLEFSFEDQLADFRLSVIKGSGEKHEFIPIYEDMPILDENKRYVSYSYINSNTVRVKFIQDKYIPKINDQINIDIICTKGEGGNFSYSDNIMIDPRDGGNIIYLGKPVTQSEFGMDKKTIDELKKIIPRELLSRGSITCSKDLENYFNILNDKYSKIKFEKKIDNQFERKYYSYLLLKDKSDNIIPTNTIDVLIDESQFIQSNDRLLLKPGTALEYDSTGDICKVIDSTVLTDSVIEGREKNGFLYTSPFTTVVNKSPLSVSTYLTIFDRTYSLVFKQISNIPLMQFISTRVQWERSLTHDSNFYKMKIELTQNIDEEYKLVEIDSMGNYITDKIKVIGVLYNDRDEPYRYVHGNIVWYDPGSKTYTYEFGIRTNNNINVDGNIEIDNLYELGKSVEIAGIFKPNNTRMMIYVLAKTGIDHNNRGELDNIVTELEGFSLCNSYEVENGIDFYINFSNMVSSVAQPILNDDDETFSYKITSLPSVRYSYINSNDRVKYFINYIMDKKVFIDSALEVLENSFGIDMKFYNTYGRSRINMVGNTNALLDRVDIRLTLKIKFISINNNDSYVEIINKEIKKYTDNMDKGNNFHMSDIITILKTKYNFISYIEFAKINNYDTSVQSIITNRNKIAHNVPEFVNIGSDKTEYVPNIDILIL